MEIPNLLWASLIIFSAIIVHELGHIFFLKHLSKDYKFYFDRWYLPTVEYTTNNLTNTQIKAIHFSGIVAGLLPIYIIGLFDINLFVAAVIIYFIGCSDDFKEIPANTNLDKVVRLIFTPRIALAVLLLIVLLFMTAPAISYIGMSWGGIVNTTDYWRSEYCKNLSNMYHYDREGNYLCAFTAVK